MALANAHLLGWGLKKKCFKACRLFAKHFTLLVSIISLPDMDACNVCIWKVHYACAVHKKGCHLTLMISHFVLLHCVVFTGVKHISWICYNIICNFPYLFSTQWYMFVYGAAVEGSTYSKVWTNGFYQLSDTANRLIIRFFSFSFFECYANFMLFLFFNK